MRVDRNVVSTLLVIAMSAKFSEQKKPEDCVLGKEFWSTFFNSNGDCAVCPRYLAKCDGQGPDQEACEKSCGDLSVSSPVRSASLTSTSTTSDLPSRLTRITSTSSVKMVASSTVLRPGKPTKYKEIHDDNEPHLWVIFLVLLATALVFSLIVIVLLLLRKRRKNMRHPVQASPSSLKIGGIQDSEGKQDSAIHLEETNC